MLTKSDRVIFEEPYGRSDLPDDTLPPGGEASYPAAGEVFHDIARTIAVFLALAVVINLLLNAFGA